MGKQSQLFRVFVEGETISDGRKITADMIDDCVATFDPKTYTPRINIEHIAGYSPEPPFNGYGDVIAVEARDDEFTIAGETKTLRALYAQVDANDQLVKLAQADQKPFPSVELTPSYAGSGKVGLVGLAFTDTPASIGTERLKFSSRAPGTIFAHGAEAVAIEFEAAPADPAKVDNAIAGFFSALTAKFKAPDADKPKEEPKPKAANDNFDVAAFTSELQAAVSGSIAAALEPVAAAQSAMQGEFATLKAKLASSEVPNGFSRAPHAGGAVDAKFATDC